MDTCRARGHSVPSYFCTLLVLDILVYAYNITIMGSGGVRKEEVNLIVCNVHSYFVIFLITGDQIVSDYIRLWSFLRQLQIDHFGRYTFPIKLLLDIVSSMYIYELMIIFGRLSDYPV